MNAIELFPTLRNLNRADKLKVMQFLVSELSRDEEPSLEHGATYSILSPLNSHAAAHQLAQLLKMENHKTI
ncbi:hypothetical protein WJM97_22055 [Okeanomitos corallinicola TIOX110]|uniref:Uncharacterized protein n=2 Tax=Okeanomitos TaxID=3231549 RepID=A0ABZ2UZ54_9CYAN